MPVPIRRIAILAATIGLGAVMTGSAAADYPTRPITVIVPWPVGGVVDLHTRDITTPLAERLGQPIIIENRTGAGGNIGAGLAARAAPDGYTLLIANTTTHGINPSLYKQLPYDPVADFDPITMIATEPLVFVVHSSVPAS